MNELKVKVVLTEEEINKIEDDFLNNIGVCTDGCFCGYAISNFRDDLSVVLSFSCRKSMYCNSNFYDVTELFIVEKALKTEPKSTIQKILDFYHDDELGFEIHSLCGKEIYIDDNEYRPTELDDVHFVRDDMKLSRKSRKAVQKVLFKYYKLHFDYFDTAKFEDIGHYKLEKKITEE